LLSDSVQSEVAQQEKRMDGLNRQLEFERKHIEDLMRERDLLTKNLQKAMSTCSCESSVGAGVLMAGAGRLDVQADRPGAHLREHQEDAGGRDPGL
jgi:uncharacterized coiled-coil protein SlyX